MRVVPALLAGLVAGCVNTNPHQQQMLSTAGPEPSREVVENSIRAYLNRTLKDPDSIKQYRLISFQKTRWLRGAIRGGGAYEDWLACVEFNAKNSYGAYVGLKTQPIVFRARDGGASLDVVPEAVTQIMSPSC